MQLAAEARHAGWQLTIWATRWACFKLCELPLDALAVGGLYPRKVGGVEIGEDGEDGEEEGLMEAGEAASALARSSGRDSKREERRAEKRRDLTVEAGPALAINSGKGARREDLGTDYFWPERRAGAEEENPKETTKELRATSASSPQRKRVESGKEALKDVGQVDTDSRVGLQGGDMKRRRLVGKQQAHSGNLPADAELGGHKRRRRKQHEGLHS